MGDSQFVELGSEVEKGEIRNKRTLINYKMKKKQKRKSGDGDQPEQQEEEGEW